MVLAVAFTFTGTVDARTLSVGSTGNDVADLQAFLVNNGYPIPLIDSGVAKPGYFGEQTKNAVKMYQEGNEMNPTGSIDSEGYQGVKLGSVTGPNFYFDYLNVNGVYTYYYSAAMRTATTTLCSFKSPNATTTLHVASWQISTGTSTAATIDLGTSTTAYSTTTNLRSADSVAANAKASVFWSPVGGSVNDAQLAPNIYINVKTAGAGLGGYTYGGKCQLELIGY